MIICPKCREPKSEDDFHRSTTRPSGRSHVCKPCGIAAVRARYVPRTHEGTCRLCGSAWSSSKPRIYCTSQCAQRAKHIADHGITVEDFLAMVARQNGCCAICDNSIGLALCIDHDHETGIVRGLLCRYCNLLIGQAGDDTDRLRAAARYLEGATL